MADRFRGGESILQLFCELFPQAPLYTLLYKKGSVGKIIEDRKITASFLDKIPGIYTHYRKFLPLFPTAASRLKIVEDADLVLSSSHCLIKAVKKPQGAKHISYIHSPMRYIYDRYEDYFGSSAPLYQRMGMRIFKNYLVRKDIQSNTNVDSMIANSQFVQRRIKKYYGRNSHLIHPFVDLDDIVETRKKNIPKENFYLAVSAFAPNKRIDLAVEVFNRLGYPLKIIGSGQQERSLKAKAKKNIEFLGNMPRRRLIDALARSKGFVFPGVEDFGIAPLEALASGTPVIAQKIGGALETLDQNVAEFFEGEKLGGAIERFEKRSFVKEKLFQRAESFSKDIFKEKILRTIEREMS